jgi:hypothetical protein
VRTNERHERSVATPIADDVLVELRARYETAYDAYQSSVLKLEEAWRAGDQPSPELQARHADLLKQLNEERARYRGALVQAAFLSDDASH